MEVINIKCASCEGSYLTIYKSGDSKCPLCGHINKILVGKDAEAELERQKKV